LGAGELTFKILICNKIAGEGIKLMEEKGCEIKKAWDLPEAQLPKIVGEYDALIIRSATEVKADFIAIHVPISPHTRHLLSTNQFNMMKDGVMIIDCYRERVVDQAALYLALVSGKVKAATVNVFEEEPPKNSKLLKLKNVIAAPHIGAQTQEAQLKTSMQIAKKVIEAQEKSAS